MSAAERQTRVRLPAAFLARAAAGAPPGSPLAALALDHAGALPAGPERDGLLAALLAGPCATSAPDWLLTEAAASEAPPVLLAALGHPDCPEGRAAAVAARSADDRLGALAPAGAPAALRAAVAAELRRRVPEPVPVTPEAAERPNAAQLALRHPELAPEVFAAAVPLLPGPPAQLAEGQELNAWMAAHGAALTTWRALWREVLTTHPGRIAELWELLVDEQARVVVSELLLGTLPHAVPAPLLVQLAEADLARFAGAALTSRICRLRVDGHQPEETAALVAEELAALPESDRRLPLAYLGAFGATPERGLATATDWIARALAERWRPLLTPDPSGPHAPTDPHAPTEPAPGAEPEPAPEPAPAPAWRTPPATRAALRDRFARAALTALDLWRPRPGFPVTQPQQLLWLAELATLLPVHRRELRTRAAELLADAERGHAHRRRRRGAYPAAEDPAFDRALTTVRRALGLGWRGIPANPPLVELSCQPPRTLERMAGPGARDATLERLLLAHAVRGYPSGPDVETLLARHTAPTAALFRLTTQLPALLGEHPGAARAWTEAVTASAHRDAPTLRALPAHLALSAPPAPGDDGRPTVLTLVVESFAQRPDAWRHFATAPLRGHTLGEAVDRAVARATP
ncbi:hypothetical protein FH609_019830 [Streptomyces sp. 3MP-14]|uniref:Uncharacterized protein n=1 Tax=Streptomyces mimosae TaxID=2586635 RepID=A0A5N5ZSM9_9ACTN|nr:MULTISPECIES: hypothetical protein [Streptomyces]KAB8158912.1 hypothetical protein FH607_028870 [Streptomyces mimosae]KAB8174848.1 hypothetical protein FH609_019830 [Streptomyces sp. 3MP-14]